MLQVEEMKFLHETRRNKIQNQDIRHLKGGTLQEKFMKLRMHYVVDMCYVWTTVGCLSECHWRNQGLGGETK